ncbi:fluoride efflux transporter CrcB [Halobacillus sp. H74]|uniref:fluoride efflux transporter CrcB n=1 Tax=Halobacillus sp. H74 TaxID=3457436 RepID=UPI003FCDCC0F
MLIIKLLLVGLGGFCGAILRYAVSRWIENRTSSTLPTATLFINIAGSFLLGVLLGLDLTKTWFLLCGTGILGAFTTFSTFKLEAIQLHINKHRKSFTYYVLASYFFGICLAYTGFKFGRWFML